MRGMTKLNHLKGTQPTLLFLTLSLTLFLLFWVVICFPILGRQIYFLTGIDLLSAVGSGVPVGPGKVALAKYVAIVFLTLNATVALALLKYKGTALRFIILALLIPIYAVSQTWWELVRFDRYNRIQIQQLTAPTFESFRKDSIKSFKDFSKYAEQLYDKEKAGLAKAWHSEDEIYLKSTFFMNLVSGLFHYGNRIDVTTPGCVTTNETNRTVDITGIQAYLKSDIGCCTDFAYLLKLLLDYSQIPNRLVLTPGHIFNEVRFGNRWEIFDATVNVSIDSSWHEIVSQKPKFLAVRESLDKKLNKTSSTYSPNLTLLKLTVFNYLLDLQPLRYSYQYDLPQYFKE